MTPTLCTKLSRYHWFHKVSANGGAGTLKSVQINLEHPPLGWPGRDRLHPPQRLLKYYRQTLSTALSRDWLDFYFAVILYLYSVLMPPFCLYLTRWKARPTDGKTIACSRDCDSPVQFPISTPVTLPVLFPNPYSGAFSLSTGSPVYSRPMPISKTT